MPGPSEDISMASPFSLFRKHERLMMAVLVLMAMIAFVFMDPIFGVRSGRTRAQDPVVAETALYGDIHESDMQRMLSGRALANRFVQQTFADLYGFTPEAYFGPDTESGVVDTMILSRKAEQMGVRVTDAEITRFLQQLSSDRITAAQFGEILQRISGRRGALSRRQLYDALRTELLARRLVDGFSGSQQATPAERWESYKQLNNRAVIAAIPVAVADFVDKVPDPDDAAVQALFDRYKQFEPTPGAPVPGFKIPAKVALEYFTADFEQFEESAAVTEKEILDEYEKNKNTRYLKRPDFDSGRKDAEAEGAESSGAEAPGPTTAPSEGEEGQKPAGETANESAPTSDQPNEAAQPEAATPAADQPDNPPKQSRDERGLDGTELALADVVAVDDAGPASAKANAAAPAGNEKPEVPNPDAANPPNESPAPEAKPDPAAAEADKPADAPADPAGADSEQAATTGEESSKYEPLANVEKTIRAQLAREKATKKMQEVLGQLREKLVKYGTERTRWEMKHDRDKTLKPPKPLDFESLAAEYDVSAHKTDLVAAIALRDAGGIGESIVGQGTSFLAYAFGQWPLYQAATSADSAGNQYLVWKTDQQPARVPELSEIRDDVVRAWKMIEARKPAVEHAKSLVETARKDELTLADLATRDELPAPIKPEPFSWLTYGATVNINNNMPPRLSAVAGIEDAGNEFMQVVFSQPVGGINIAFNNPQSICYVVEVTEFEPGLPTLQRTFLADDYRTYARVALPRQQQMVLAWNNSIKQEAGLKWVRPPDARRARPGSAEEFDEGPAEGAPGD
jgi:SurA N-terminal domain